MIEAGNDGFRGTFRVVGDGVTCLLPLAGGAERCFVVYVRDGDHLAFDLALRQVARFSPSP